MVTHITPVVTGESPSTINIRPRVNMLALLPSINYRPWFAMAEFVDNSLQSFLAYRDELERVEGTDFKLKVSIELDTTDEGRITIRDNAAGIHESDYARAFRPAEAPPDSSGLSEFGMGMKSAACWFARKWSVRTSALGEPLERTVSFDIDAIVRDDIEELDVRSREVPSDAHYTEIILSGLHKTPKTQTVSKMKDHLASIFRVFLRDGLLTLTLRKDELSFPNVPVLEAPHFKDPSGDLQRWEKAIDLDFGLGLRAHGFAALRAVGSTSEAGFALFRRKRLIQGSRDEAYRPEVIFGKSNSYIYQRLFGELHLDGFEVSHTKDGFRWEEHEEIVLSLLKAELDRSPLPLLSQADGYRTRARKDDLRSGAEVATQRTAETIAREAPGVLQHQLDQDPEPRAPEPTFPPATTAAGRIIDVQLDGCHWQVELDLSGDPAVGDWVSVYDQPVRGTAFGDHDVRRVGIRMACAHPFMERFAGADASQIEPLLRVAVALVLAEITARDSGVSMAGTVRRNVNELLRDALSKP